MDKEVDKYAFAQKVIEACGGTDTVENRSRIVNIVAEEVCRPCPELEPKPTFGSEPKYSIAGKIRNIQTGAELDASECLIFRINDAAVPDMLASYRVYCEQLSRSPKEHIEAVRSLRYEVKWWQKEHPELVKAAD